MKYVRTLRKLRKNAKAVSPVVATLMLVLIAVGSSAALYLWLGGWQNQVTEGIGQPGSQASFTIGGSSTVFEFTKQAVPLFEQANRNIRVDFQSGGSGAGVIAVGTGAVDIGSTSRALDPAEKAAYPDLNRDGVKDTGAADLKEWVIAYDGVVLMTGGGNHGITSMNSCTLLAIYALNTGHPLTEINPSQVGSGKACAAAGDIPTDTSANGKFEWTEIPASTAAPCTVPASCGTGAGSIVVYDRSDAGGTEETFVNKMLKLGSKQLQDPTLLSGGAIITGKSFEGNQGVIAACAADANCLGFNPFAQATASGSGVSALTTFAIDGSTAVTASAATIKAQTYPGSRPLEYITIGVPTGAVKVYLDYVLGPDNNQLICQKSGYFSIYA